MYSHFILSGTETAQLVHFTRGFLAIYLFSCTENSMSNLLYLDDRDRDICWLPPASSLGGEVDVRRTSERELSPFFFSWSCCWFRDLRQPVRETIGFAAVRAD
jgi:hypothetical protein